MPRDRGGAGPTGPSPSALDAIEREHETIPVDPESLLREHGDMVFNLAVRLTGDRDEARDLTQDAFIRILRGAASFRGESSPRTWIFRIVVNVHRNRLRWWRRRRRDRTISLDQPLEARDAGDGGTVGSRIADDSPGPDRRVESTRATRRLESALAALPSDQRVAILLRECEGMSYAEIAVAVGVREGTIKSRIARAREALRAALPDLAGSGGTS